tara:strand:+ start:113 stop:406 length:294 start_codon:yes stop_codon:yes gene_type:complete
LTKLKINGLMNDKEIRWKKIPCSCSTKKDDVLHQFPIKECLHCKFQACEDSMPRETWTVHETITNPDTKKLINKTRTISEINIKRGKKYHDIIGWSF